MPDDKPVKKREQLTDVEVEDVLHRMAFDLQFLSGVTTMGDTAIKTARAAMLLLTAAMIKGTMPTGRTDHGSGEEQAPAAEPQPPPEPS